MSLPPLGTILSKSTPKKKPRKKVILKNCKYCNWLMATNSSTNPICKNCEADKFLYEEEMNQINNLLSKSSPRKGGGKKKKKVLEKKRKKKEKRKLFEKEKRKLFENEKKNNYYIYTKCNNYYN